MAEYPLPRFYFKVDWVDGANITTIVCSEVTGLVMEREKIEYRDGHSPDYSKISMPGLVKNSNITLKRGKFESNKEFNDWQNAIAKDRVGNRKDVSIALVNEKGEAIVTWIAMRCFPVKITAPDLKSDANEIAIESIEIAHEGLRLKA